MNWQMGWTRDDTTLIVKKRGSYNGRTSVVEATNMCGFGSQIISELSVLYLVRKRQIACFHIFVLLCWCYGLQYFLTFFSSFFFQHLLLGIHQLRCRPYSKLKPSNIIGLPASVRLRHPSALTYDHLKLLYHNMAEIKFVGKFLIGEKYINKLQFVMYYQCSFTYEFGTLPLCGGNQYQVVVFKQILKKNSKHGRVF